MTASGIYTPAEDGGPAFAQSDLSAYGMGPAETQNRGMSLRDYFAAAALGGVWTGRESDFVKLEDPTADQLAKSAYRIADAMLKARKP